MVAAWIRALTGVGPAMASGSQVCSGSCADLPMAPPSSSSAAATARAEPAGQAAAARAQSAWMSSVPSCVNSRKSPSDMAVSPTRVTMNALRRGVAVGRCLYQKPISR